MWLAIIAKMETISYKKFLVKFTEDAYMHDCPVNGNFELTPLCNLDCKMCYVHLQDFSVHNSMLSGEQWISLMQQAINHGMLHAVLTGGEAMTHPDFWKIYLYLITHGVSVRVKSNGLLINKDAIGCFKHYPPDIIDISLYGCNSESYVAVTGVDAYERVVNNIRCVIDAGMRLRLMVTPSSYMQPWTEQIMDFAKSFGVKVVVNSLLIEPYENTHRTKADFDLTNTEYDRIRAKREELFPLQLMTPAEEEDIYGELEKSPDVSARGLYCNAGRSTFGINWDGTMSPCLGFPRKIVCANPLHDGFAQAWMQINKVVKDYEIPQKCHYCPINTKCHYCPTQHSRVSHLHLCDLSICSFWENTFKNKSKKEEQI